MAKILDLGKENKDAIIEGGNAFKRLVAGKEGFELKPNDSFGFSFDASGAGFKVLFFPYWDFPDASVDEGYLTSIVDNMKFRGGIFIRVYAPINYISFLNDYVDTGGVRFELYGVTTTVV